MGRLTFNLAFDRLPQFSIPAHHAAWNFMQDDFISDAFYPLKTFLPYLA